MVLLCGLLMVCGAFGVPGFLKTWKPVWFRVAVLLGLKPWFQASVTRWLVCWGVSRASQGPVKRVGFAAASAAGGSRAARCVRLLRVLPEGQNGSVLCLRRAVCTAALRAPKNVVL